MKRITALLILAGAVLLATSAPATTVPTNWWSNRTDDSNVHDPWDSERVRLGDFTSGYVEGVVNLPEWGFWKITFRAHTDETWDHPSEYIAIYIDGIYVHRLFNTPTPPTTRFEFDHAVAGDRFGYRFEFSSPVADVGHHMMMDPGFVELVPVVPVSIDIKPRSDSNRVNPGSKGVLPVAILTTSTSDGDPLDFDAWEVDASTLAFGSNGAPIAHASAHAEDVDGDGDLDMLVHFRIGASGIACGDTEAELTGETVGGQLIAGTDAVKTAGCRSQSARRRAARGAARRR